MIIDTHCHYNLLEDDWRTAWNKAQTHGVTGAIVVGVADAANQRAIEIAAAEPRLKAAIGLHPENYVLEHAISQDELLERCRQAEQSVTAISQLVSNNVIAIGEAGLDYFRLPADPAAQHHTRQLQRHVFIQHVLFAQEHHLPLIIHVRDSQLPEQPTTDNAYWDSLKILREYHQGQEAFILHCVSGPLSYIQAAIDLGGYIGIAGNVTYKNADHIRSIVKTVPPNRVLLETDAPFLPPVPHRGQACEPWMISLTAQYLEEELGIAPQTYLTNTLNLFPAFGESMP